ncbi:MAG: transaldolase [Candidatus Binatia bacterium]
MEKEAQNRLRTLLEYGQSVWLDYIRRDLIINGGLARLIDEDGLRGMTSNPSIFEKAIVGSADYQDILLAPEARQLDAKALYEKIAIRDIQDAADLLRPAYERSSCRDGYVSLEVSPLLAHDTPGTVAEARRLWAAVERPNLMIKVPGTAEGIPAIRQLIGEGLNINVTLLFAQRAYEQVAAAYIAGLEQAAERGADLRHLASVASFFVSRIDTAVDAELTARIDATPNAARQAELRGLLGKTAIANAKIAYQEYLRIFRGPRWQTLADNGAGTQRVLWASTSTKNPAYRDVVYVEELIGRDTVNTIPPATLEAFRDHGVVRASLTEDVGAAHTVMQRIAEAGISIDRVTDTLLVDAVRLFAEPFKKLLDTVGKYAR